MKILLLEDDHILCETLKLFLEDEGFEVDIALTIKEAIELTFNNSYDLYLLDINIGDGNGLELFKELKEAEDETPAIFITAMNDLNYISQSFELGALDYIKKPFEPEELLIRIYAKFQRRVIKYGNIEYDIKKDIIKKDGQIVDLGYLLHNVFATLIKKRGNIVYKEELLEFFENKTSSALRVAITKIKNRLKIDIKNIRGRGYMIE